MSDAMHYVKRFLCNMIFLVILSSLCYGQENNVRLILSVKKADFGKIKQAVESVKGKVNIEHKFIEAMAVTIPADQVKSIISRPEVISSRKDLRVYLPNPGVLNKYDQISGKDVPHLRANHSKVMTTDELKAEYAAGAENYYPFTNKLTNAHKFIKQTGHTGEGVIVAVMDAGISSAADAVADRILGGENFTDDGIPATSPLNGWHGTGVACCIGANAIFGFDDPTIQNAVKNYAPNSVIEDYFEPGIDGIPMVGQAPGVSFYALKVFRYNENWTETSTMVAALERAIELKEQFNSGTGGINIRVLNISIGGMTIFAGNDPVFAPLVVRALDAGIVLVKSAGNEGPSGMTISWPGDVRNIITTGATNDATHQRIYSDIVYGPDYGYLFRPVDNNLIVYFSSRGPNADGRPDPDIVAPGAYRFMQTSGGGITIASGTSFSAPTLAGAVALLISARPESTPYEIRGALLNGADKALLAETAGLQDQGFGFLDVYKAYQKLTAGTFNPPDIGISGNVVGVNIYRQDNISTITSPSFSTSTEWLHPGQRAEYYYAIPKATGRITVTISNITPSLPPDQQNQLYGDNVMFSIQGARTSYGEYLQGTPVQTGADRTFVLEGQDLSLGILRVTVLGNWKNAGDVMANVSITSEFAPLRVPSFTGNIMEGQTSEYAFKVPSGTRNLEMRLYWKNGWENYPTNDLDVVLYDPNGQMIVLDLNNDDFLDGQSVSMPEIVSVDNPVPGDWTAEILIHTLCTEAEEFQLFKILDTESAGKSLPDADVAAKSVPAEFSLQQNIPNPFNPATTIKYDLPHDTYMTLKVYNSLGQLVRTLVNEVKSAGYHSVYFNGRDDNGNELSSGMYIYQLSSEKFVKSGKMMMIK